MNKVLKRIFFCLFFCLVLSFLYFPIFLIILFSFTESNNFKFTFNIYRELFRDNEILNALFNTFIIAIISSFFSTLLGIMCSFSSYLNKKINKINDTIMDITVVNPEIIIALSLTILFINFKISFGFWSLIIGHICLSFPFVYFSIKPKLQQINISLYEAAMDLGCTSKQAFFKIIIPQISSGIFSGFFLSMIISFDDFIVTSFLRGPCLWLFDENRSIETLSTLIQAKIVKGSVPSTLRALTTLFFALIFIVAICVFLWQNCKYKKNNINFGN